VLWARGLETQKRGVIHYHYLMSRVPGEVMRLVMMDAWDNMAGFAKIYPFRLTRVRSATTSANMPRKAARSTLVAF